MFNISNELSTTTNANVNANKNNTKTTSAQFEEIIRDYLVTNEREEDDFLSNVQKAENAFFARWKELNRVRIQNQSANWTSFLAQFQIHQKQIPFAAQQSSKHQQHQQQQQLQQQQPPKLPNINGLIASLPSSSSTSKNGGADSDEFKCKMNGCKKTYTTKGNLNRHYKDYHKITSNLSPLLNSDKDQQQQQQQQSPPPLPPKPPMLNGTNNPFSAQTQTPLSSIFPSLPALSSNQHGHVMNNQQNMGLNVPIFNLNNQLAMNNVNPLMYGQPHATTTAAVNSTMQQSQNKNGGAGAIPLSMLQILSSMNSNQLNPNVLKQLLVIQNLKNVNAANANANNVNMSQSVHGMPSLLKENVQTNNTANLSMSTTATATAQSSSQKEEGDPFHILMQAVDAMDAKKKKLAENASSDITSMDDMKINKKRTSNNSVKKKRKKSKSTKKRKHKDVDSGDEDYKPGRSSSVQSSKRRKLENDSRCHSAADIKRIEADFKSGFCSLCKRVKNTTNYNWRNHLESEHRYYCQQCTDRFTQKKQMEEHIKKKHSTQQ